MSLNHGKKVGTLCGVEDKCMCLFHNGIHKRKTIKKKQKQATWYSRYLQKWVWITNAIYMFNI